MGSANKIIVFSGLSVSIEFLLLLIFSHLTLGYLKETKGLYYKVTTVSMENSLSYFFLKIKIKNTRINPSAFKRRKYEENIIVEKS